MTISTQTVILDSHSLNGFEPMAAATMFAEEIGAHKCINNIVRVKVELHGSFASQDLKDLIGSTIVSGLQAQNQEKAKVSPAQVDLQQVRQSKRLLLAASKEIYFDLSQDLLIQQQDLPTQSSGITISAKDVDGDVLMQRAYWLAA
jgi:hypothetical protein